MNLNWVSSDGWVSMLVSFSSRCVAFCSISLYSSIFCDSRLERLSCKGIASYSAGLASSLFSTKPICWSSKSIRYRSCLDTPECCQMVFPFDFPKHRRAKYTLT